MGMESPRVVLSCTPRFGRGTTDSAYQLTPLCVELSISLPRVHRTMAVESQRQHRVSSAIRTVYAKKMWDSRYNTGDVIRYSQVDSAATRRSDCPVFIPVSRWSDCRAASPTASHKTRRAFVESAKIVSIPSTYRAHVISQYAHRLLPHLRPTLHLHQPRPNHPPAHDSQYRPSALIRHIHPPQRQRPQRHDWPGAISSDNASRGQFSPIVYSVLGVITQAMLGGHAGGGARGERCAEDAELRMGRYGLGGGGSYLCTFSLDG
jgi:hypothetical protein